MILYAAGETSKAICDGCKSVVSTTFAYRDVPFDDGTGLVKDILCAVCDRCDRVVAVPPQSTPAIKRARDAADVPLEVMLLAPEIERLDLAIWRIDPDAGQRLRKPLLVRYIRRFADDPAALALLQAKAGVQSARSPRADKTPKRRLSVKIAPKTDHAINRLMAASGLKKSDLIRAIIHQIDMDLVRPDKPKDLETLRAIAWVVAA
jgi:hypothetical protein